MAIDEGATMKMIHIVVIMMIFLTRCGASAHERGKDATLGALTEAVLGTASAVASTVVGHKVGPHYAGKTRSTTASKAPSPKQGASVRDVGRQQEFAPVATTQAITRDDSPQSVDVLKFPPIPPLE